MDMILALKRVENDVQMAECAGCAWPHGIE